MKDFLRLFDSDPESLFAEILAVKKSTERQRRLRGDIIKRFLASVLTDDERAVLNGLPEGCRMRENAKIIAPEKFVCGSHVWIGEGAMLDASGGLKIGDHSTIGTGVMVWSHHSALSNLCEKNQSGNQHIVNKATHIGRGCFIVGPSVINPGVRIGDHVMVLPMTVVTKNVPSGHVVSGSPARVMRKIDPDYIKHLRNGKVSN